MSRDLNHILNDQVSFRLLQHKGDRAESESSKQPKIDANVVAISNMIGANGRKIAARAAELLGLHCYDREIVKYIADKAHVRASTVETIDEHSTNGLEDFIASLLRGQGFSNDDHFKALSSIVIALWKRGPCVLTGHGAVHHVPREHALRVRIIAPIEVRIQRVAESGQMDTAEAKKRVIACDSERISFHSRFFHADIRDDLLFDMVINTGHLDDECSAEIIANAYRSRFAGVK